MTDHFCDFQFVGNCVSQLSSGDAGNNKEPWAPNDLTQHRFASHSPCATVSKGQLFPISLPHLGIWAEGMAPVWDMIVL